MRSLKVSLIAGTLALAVPASAELPASPLGDIYESYNDCFKVATKDGMRPEVLGTLGWARATVSNDGEEIASAPAIFGHPERAPIIILSAEQGEGVCIVSARLENAKAFEEFKDAWGGQLPKPDEKGAISFFAEGHAIQLRRTGSPDKPAMTIAVMTPTESK